MPYFLTGLEADWEVSEQVDLGFYLIGTEEYFRGFYPVKNRVDIYQ